MEDNKLRMVDGPLEPLEPLIREVRGHRVILDSDLARLYRVPTKRFNEAFKRNRQRFPRDFAFQLSIAEFGTIRGAQGVDPRQDSGNWSQNATSPRVAHVSRHRGVAYRPWAFTEHGALMAANVLRSPSAVQMSVFVVRAFVRLREHVAANAAIVKRLAEIDQALLQHDSALRDLYRKLQALLAPPPVAPKRRIGF